MKEIKMQNEFSRTGLMLGKDALKQLKMSTVAIFGIGGVGSYTAEALARAGIGHLVLIDDDSVCLTNINRQLIALHSTLGLAKVDVMRDRILDINPKAKVTVHKRFYLPECADELLSPDYDYIVDAIDTVTAKIDLAVRAHEMEIPIISCMGAGSKLDPTRFEVADVFSTSVCPLAKVMRKELKARGVDHLKVVYSKETPVELIGSGKDQCSAGCVCPPDSPKRCMMKNRVPGSISFVPSVAGLIMAGEVVKDLIQGQTEE